MATIIYCIWCWLCGAFFAYCLYETLIYQTKWCALYLSILACFWYGDVIYTAKGNAMKGFIEGVTGESVSNSNQ